jgi:DNA-binding transcriptional regulator GbsR (MarR family)
MASWQIAFVEQSRALTALTGLPPSVAKVFLWLVVCEPPQQSGEQIREALGLSAAAVSTATNALTARGLVDRVTPPGQRRIGYRLHPHSPSRLMRHSLETIAQVRSIVDTALAAATEPQPRLTELRAMYAAFEHQVTRLLTDRDDQPASTE